MWSASKDQPAPQPEGPPDEQIVERVLAGDAAAFELLMRRHNAGLYRAVRSIIREETEVEDVMQAVYLRAYAKLGSFRKEARFRTWLTQIALHEALGRLRSERRHPSVSLTLLEEPAMESTAPIATPELQASRRELAALLERAVDGLPELYRVVFVLREVDGMDTAETARALDVSEDVVKTRLSRARAALRQSLESMVGAAAGEAFPFHASRCDRVVSFVMARLSRSR